MMHTHKVLLLNASNMAAFPIYPYAFIQVPAVARRDGIEVVCTDLLGVPPERWGQTIETLIDEHNPSMVLITLRNTDSLTIQDYEPDETRGEGHQPYFPIERTRELIALLRKISAFKIAVGGFGFSVMPADLMGYLEPDFGVLGEPDGFFAHFGDIQAGNLQDVPNLLYYQGEQLIANPRRFYPPLAEPEYTPQAIGAMMAFYKTFPDPGFLGAPVEIMRGCPHTCVFCCEPHVAGKTVRYRDPSAVMADVQILVDNGITKLYMISSELNPEGNQFILELGDRLQAFNNEQPATRRITWFGANYLLNFNTQEYERLHQSGFTGGWFDVTALDDHNARAMRTPYRNYSLIPLLKTYAQYKQRQSGTHPDNADSTSERMDGALESNVEPLPITWTMFLGNPATTLETIRETLRVASQSGIAQIFTNCSLSTNIRVFEYENPDPATLAMTSTITPDLERTTYQQILPSFAYPPVLLRDFGSEAEIERFFKHIGETYLSTKYQETRDWLGFVKARTTPESVTGWIMELSDVHRYRFPPHFRPDSGEKPPGVLGELFSDEPEAEGEQRDRENLAVQLVDSLLSACLNAIPDIFGMFGLPASDADLERSTPYHLSVSIFSRWQSEDDLIRDANAQTESLLGESMVELIDFCIQAMIYRFNLRIEPVYKKLFTQQ